MSRYQNLTIGDLEGLPKDEAEKLIAEVVQEYYRSKERTQSFVAEILADFVSFS